MTKKPYQKEFILDVENEFLLKFPNYTTLCEYVNEHRNNAPKVDDLRWVPFKAWIDMNPSPHLQGKIWVTDTDIEELPNDFDSLLEILL